MQKNGLFTCIVFFPDHIVKKYRRVQSPIKLAKHFDDKRVHWRYINVYNRQTKEFVERLYRGTTFDRV